MTNPYRPPAAELVRPEEEGPTIGAAISGTFATVSLPMLASVAALQIPYLVTDLRVDEWLEQERFGLLTLGFAAYLLLYPLESGLVISGARSAHAGAPASLRALWRGAIRAWPRLFTANLLAGLVVVAGLIAFVVPGLYFAVRVSFVSAIAFEEQPGAAGALRGSEVIVKRRFWTVVLLWAVFLVPGFAIEAAYGALTVLSPAADSVGLAALVTLASYVIATLVNAALWRFYRDHPRYGSAATPP